jgi:hypothetical protein
MRWITAGKTTGRGSPPPTTYWIFRYTVEDRYGQCPEIKENLKERKKERKKERSFIFPSTA